MGRVRPLVKKPRLHLYNFLSEPAEILPPPPAAVDYTKCCKTMLAQVLGNDVLSDCTTAGAFHIAGSLIMNAGGTILWTDAQYIPFYSASTGYVPGDASTDQGGDEQEVLNFWKNNGLLADASHKIAGFMAVNSRNIVEIKQAIALFGNVYFGVEMPDEWIKPFPEADGFTWDVAGNADENNGHCFTSDTKVSLLNGNEVSFKELATGKYGDKFWVYSCDDKGNVVPGLAHSVRKTRSRADIVKVTLDNGEVIKCTPDHLFMLRDKTYIKASEMTPGTSLMPLYREYNERGYERFYNPANGKWGKTYIRVAKKVYNPPKGMDIHHWDFDKNNNDPSNLVIMSREEHSILHQQTAGVLKSYAKSDKGRKKSSELMKNLWADPEWRAVQTARLRSTASARGKRNIENGGGFPGMDPDKLKKMQRKNGKKLAKLCKDPAFIEANKYKAADGLRRKIDSDPEYRATLVANAKKGSIAAAKLPVTEEQRKARRNNIKLARAAKEYRNHKVLSVVPAGKQDVYDMTVIGHHNFALSAGVFVHNCFVGLGYNDVGIIIDTWGIIGTITWAAVEEYCANSVGGELWTCISKDAIASGLAEETYGLNWSKMEAEFAALGGSIKA